MSRVTTTTVDTISSTTDLTVTTGNTISGKIVMRAGSGPAVYGNSSAITYTSNSSGNFFPLPSSFSNSASFTTASFDEVSTTNCTAALMTTTGNTTVGGRLTVSTNTFNLGTSTIGTANASSGYTYLPNGLKLNWGTVLANSSTGTATFSNAFSVNCFCVTATAVGTAGNVVWVTTMNTTTASIRSNLTTGTGTTYYMAIGV